ncbi:hypothetical protein [Sphingomonas sp. DBB INV C78]|uniref:hypothetical protein n=1 Tax=Sphingomonas sp. DBB INV C78 TaxID=3349434 RepID=UPI0036D43FEC
MFDDRAYLERRLREEQAAVEASTCLEAREIHRQLARQFERKIQAIEEGRVLSVPA